MKKEKEKENEKENENENASANANANVNANEKADEVHALDERSDGKFDERSDGKSGLNEKNKRKSVKRKFSVSDITFMAMFVAVMTVCSWISIPLGTIPFTLQTFGVFVTLGLLGGRRGTLSVTVFILLGMTGVPVFSGMKGGLSVLTGATGGYIIGFIFLGLIMWLFEHFFGNKTWSLVVSMILGLAVCYAFGTVWFKVVYMSGAKEIAFATVLAKCVIPFLIPDAVKMALAVTVVKLLKKYIPQ